MRPKCVICKDHGATRKCGVCESGHYHLKCIKDAIQASEDPTYTCGVCRAARYSVVHDAWASICTDCREHRDNPGDDEDMFWRNAATAQRAVTMADGQVGFLFVSLVLSLVCVTIAHHDLFAWLPWPVIVVICVVGIANERIPVRPWFRGKDDDNIRHAWYILLVFMCGLVVMRSVLHAWHTPTYLVVVVPILAYVGTRCTPEVLIQDGTTFVIGKRHWWR